MDFRELNFLCGPAPCIELAVGLEHALHKTSQGRDGSGEGPWHGAGHQWLVQRRTGEQEQPAVGGHGGICPETDRCGAGFAAAQEVSLLAGTKCGGPACSDTMI